MLPVERDPDPALVVEPHEDEPPQLGLGIGAAVPGPPVPVVSSWTEPAAAKPWPKPAVVVFENGTECWLPKAFDGCDGVEWDVLPHDADPVELE